MHSPETAPDSYTQATREKIVTCSETEPEKQVLASRDHPNIAQIHGIEKTEDTVRPTVPGWLRRLRAECPPGPEGTGSMCFGTRSVHTWRFRGAPARALQELAGHANLSTPQR